MIGVDSLGYLSEAALAELAKSCRLNFCTACFNGKYPVPLVTPAGTFHL